MLLDFLGMSLINMTSVFKMCCLDFSLSLTLTSGENSCWVKVDLDGGLFAHLHLDWALSDPDKRI